MLLWSLLLVISVEFAIAKDESEPTINFQEVEALFNEATKGFVVQNLTISSTWALEEAASAPQILLERQSGPRGYDLMTGHLSYGVCCESIFGDVVLTRRPSDNYTTILTTLSTGDTWMRMGSSNSTVVGYTNNNTILDSQADYQELSSSLSTSESSLVDMDAEGRSVIDVLCVFALSDPQILVDTTGYCIAQIEGVNQAFVNSRVTDVKLRMVGTLSIQGELEISEAALSSARSIVASSRVDVGADLIAIFTSAIDPALSSFSYLHGDLSIQSITTPGAFRHSIGHNVGIKHCNDNAHSNGDFGHGYSDGMLGTIMCKETVNFYSTPNLAIRGVALGEALTADSVKRWNLNHGAMSSFMPAVVPMDHEDRVTIYNEVLTFSGNSGFRVTLEVPQNLTRVVALAVDSSDLTSDVAVGLQRIGDSKLHAINATHAAHIQLRNPPKGHWTLGTSADGNKTLSIALYGYQAKSGLVNDELKCVINTTESGVVTGAKARWLDASTSSRADGTNDGLEFSWEVVKGDEDLYFMPGGTKVPSTLLLFEAEVPKGEIKLTCMDKINNKNASARATFTDAGIQLAKK